MKSRTIGRILQSVAFSALLVLPALSWSDSGVGVDTWRANKLDPTGGEELQRTDADGTSWLEPDNIARRPGTCTWCHGNRPKPTP
jgi:hypothetical protein